MFEEKHRNKMFIQLWGRQTESVNINAWPKLVENALGIDVLSSCKVEKGGQMICLFNWNNWDKEASMLDSDGLKMLWGSTSSPLLMLVISSLLSGRSWFRNTRRQNGDTYLCVFFLIENGRIPNTWQSIPFLGWKSHSQRSSLKATPCGREPGEWWPHNRS